MASVLDKLSRFSTIEQVRNWLGLGRSVATKDYDPPSIADGGVDSTTVSLPGAALGDFVEAAVDADLQGIELHAYVESAGTVRVRFANQTGSSVDLGSLQVRVLLKKR